MNAKTARKRPRKKKLHWLVQPKTIRRLWQWGIGVLAMVTLLDLVIVAHPYFGIDGFFGFYAWYGLLTCAAMIVVAKALGVFLKRPDTYYGEDRE
jgi:hypothetical protein